MEDQGCTGGGEVKKLFKIGDVVWLNSGSPPLTVTDNEPMGDISVAWISDTEEPQRMTLPTECFCTEIPKGANV